MVTGDKRMQPILSGKVGTMILTLLLTGVSSAHAQQPAEMKIPAPELQGIDAWINSKPVSLADLKGKVVVLHFWTFG
jgi:hypothetical protein